ncbi:vegetative cell wall protein gp1-like [Abrus precatorius]|uniref:Vegetative cell wall protein gp1-like n=1 Tax=Abrus precatorius TaxID=3816 RepID=A0A8B8L9U2_ABRPR|nr:vegetative cell wall protein gp1-like [Abrus precatorius]
MSWFLVILFLSLTFGTHSQAIQDKKLPSAVVVGTVYCDTCFQQDFSMGSHFISGASVAVECKDGYGSSKSRFRKEVKTDEHGEFKVQLPFSVSKHVKRIKGCTVTLLSSSEPYCAVASAATSSSIRLKSKKQGLHIFSAGFFSFKPLKQPNLCNQKPSIQNIKGLGSVKTLFPQKVDPSFPPPLKDPNSPGGLLPTLSPLPGLPSLPPMPTLPPLPPLPGLTAPWSPPVPATRITNESPNVEPSDQKVADPENFIFPPNPLFPPPIVPNPLQPPPLVRSSPIVPNPFQPTNPTPFIPNPLLPPPSGSSPLLPFPPQVPGLTPSPSPSSPSPTSPFPFLPLLPPPSSPGTPPAKSSKNASP